MRRITAQGSVMGARWALLGLGLCISTTVCGEVFEFAGRTSTLERAGPADGPAAYNFTTREPDGRLRARRVLEQAQWPRVRTNALQLDAAYAMALEEAHGNAVESITDGQFDHGTPMDCHCFKTGVKWPYVWTRDTSYSTDLGIGLVDPIRARNSLAFKQSNLDPAVQSSAVHEAASVAQDTGSGGSWPISSDRVVWIHAAAKLIPLLPGSAAGAWEDEVYRTALETLRQDRLYVRDGATGLYRGETSFLDWREQTYPAWTRNDTLAIASSYALSTNVLHYLALRDTAALAARRQDPIAAQLSAETRQLGDAIARYFRKTDSGLYPSYLLRDLAPVETYDLLSLALMQEAGLLDDKSAQRMLAAYPVGEGGPPVIWPERADVPIYHNRAAWPFVTAYALRAAERAHDAPHAVAYMQSLLRGAAIALSHQENAEFLTLAPHFEDGTLSGPVINSESQLWSVAGMLDAVVRGVFGVTTDWDGVRVSPSFPALITGHRPDPGSTWVLTGLRPGDARTTVTLHFPARISDTDWLYAGTIRLDGRVSTPSEILPMEHIPSHIDVELASRPAGGEAVQVVHVADAHHLTRAEHERLYAPDAPSIDALAEDQGRVRIAVGGLNAGHSWELWRDGAVVGRGRAAIARDRMERSHGAACYTLTQQTAQGRRSLPSAERCLPASEGTIEISAVDPAVTTTGPVSREAGPPRLAQWGAPAATLEFSVRLQRGGKQRLTAAYRNDGRINTGVTAAVKAVAVDCHGSQTHGTLVMPQLGDPLRQGRSTPIEFTAPAGATCRVTLSDAMNMSYLAHFRHYTAGRGGSDGPANTADLLGFRIEPVEAGLHSSATPLTHHGK